MYFWILLVASCTFIIHIILDLCFSAVIFKPFRFFCALKYFKNTFKKKKINKNKNTFKH